jgi:hypothetical protein
MLNQHQQNVKCDFTWQSFFLKSLSYFLLILVLWLIVTPRLEATTCQYLAEKKVCLQQIKRSAKYYWEYRVSLSSDGQKQPPRIYNCRDRYYTLPDRTQVYYRQSDRLSKLVCRLYSE